MYPLMIILLAISASAQEVGLHLSSTSFIQIISTSLPISTHLYPSPLPLYKRILQIILKVTIPKTRRRIPEIRPLDRRSRPRRQTLPCHNRLLSALIPRPNKLMINREIANVPNLRPRAIQIRARRLLIIAMSGDSHTADGGTRRRRGQPDDDVLPVVAVAETRRGAVFGHVPRVHYGVGAVVGGGAGVDLAGGGGAAA